MDRTRQAVDIFNRYARQYHERFRDVSLYAATLDRFIAGIPASGAEILELACGPGNITKYVLKQRPDLQILATDLAPNMLEIARLINPGAEFMMMDCREIRGLGKKFHGVICGFCLPYLSREECHELFAGISASLHQDGLLYISTMEDNYDRSGVQTTAAGEQMHLYYHEGTQLQKSLEENKFSILGAERKKYVDHHGNHTTDLLILAQKQ